MLLSQALPRGMIPGARTGRNVIGTDKNELPQSMGVQSLKVMARVVDHQLFSWLRQVLRRRETL